MVKTYKTIFELCDIGRETSFALQSYHRNGHLEKVYENGLKVEQQHPLPVFDEDGTLLGDFYADLFIEDCLIVELKAVKVTTNEHAAQILGYLRSSGIEHGLLINFGASRLYIKKYALSRNL
ncbi:MAG: GxxExxY protein [Verrucomicrobiales bacterium]